MQTKLSDGSVMICGNVGKDGELKFVGAKNTPQCKIGVAVGKRGDETVWCNVTAWRGCANVLATASKGDAILVVGKVETHEYNGKNYSELVAEFVNVAHVSDAAEVHTSAPAADFAQLTDDDDSLPF